MNKYLKLSIGLLLQALGIALVIKSNSTFPITAFNLGVANTLAISYGTASMLVELITILINCCFKENIGLTTIASAILNGYIVDLFLHLIPDVSFNLIYLPIGALTMCFGFYFMSSCGLGLNSSNGLMNALMKKTGKSVTLIRTLEEMTFMLLGYILGGTVNITTIVLSTCFGSVLGFVYKLLNFEPEKVQHKNLTFKKHINKGGVKIGTMEKD